MSSRLILCGNHLGNPKDIPIRTVEALKAADIIYCEDTRTAARLLSEHDIHVPLRSYFDQNERKRVEELRKELQGSSLEIALISEAGMPLVSDPGYHIVNLFHELGLDVEMIPGPSACLMALAMSGFSLHQFRFLGFWPLKAGKQKAALEDIQNADYPFVFYESPYRIVSTIDFLAANCPNLKVFVCRELTKPYQQYFKGCATDVQENLKTSTVKGEYTVAVSMQG